MEVHCRACPAKSLPYALGARPLVGQGFGPPVVGLHSTDLPLWGCTGCFTYPLGRVSPNFRVAEDTAVTCGVAPGFFNPSSVLGWYRHGNASVGAGMYVCRPPTLVPEAAPPRRRT
ncbi:hypothetical protein WOLCODRAFT_147410 [Wolfiporia cocos MD-104 SS10]|uniref:Uncharacterized protein n=1 Tax=Wolfiporia cocos (strain MD-104) TaxID=742152 RepID=A0A2H3IUC0_WOLCO|nr:hypothetical protein WOLCODRAFT_147410 [Wolfiporia cocos MD-104 SS10]